MALPAIYRKVNPQWILDFTLAHSNNAPSGYFNAAYVSPDPYVST